MGQPQSHAAGRSGLILDIPGPDASLEGRYTVEQRRSPAVVTCWLLVGSLLVGCGAGSEPAGPGGGGTPDEMPREIKVRPSFDRDIQAIIEGGGCTSMGCHGETPGPANLSLVADPGANYRALVDRPSHSEPEFRLVEPGDAQNSYVIIRLENRQSVGSSMPVGGRLDDIDLTNFRNWIDNGAPDN